ncbi:MAG: hypothetical protein HOP00_03385 [Nitrospira sp.]|nr:hypothetical protein [Nitrospira sp.]
MSEHDLEKLLGGFAADTLTREERQTLFTAALQDQQLFNALADEQALKELLADPAVRHRLLASLEQKSASGAERSFSWLDWFRRPAGLAFAGGLTAAALAVVLGIRIYQDSLKQAAQSVVTEEARPATAPAPIPPATQPTPPHVTEPQAKAKENATALVTPAKKDLLDDKIAKRERAEQPAPQEQRASEIARDSLKKANEQDQVRRQANAPVAALGKTAQEATSSADQQLTASPAPSAMSAPAPMQAPAVSARTLFYSGEAARTDNRTMAQEKERASTPLAESMPPSNRTERKLDRFALAGKAVGTAAQLKPLGLRYSFIVAGADGQDREVDTATAVYNTAPVRLILEVNQAAYLQVWMTVGSSPTQLLLPEKKTGQISLKITAGQRQQIPLPKGNGPVTLTVRLSRVPFGPITNQEAAMSDRLSPDQLQEAVTQEQATYVVNQDPTPTAQISVEIPFSR